MLPPAAPTPDVADTPAGAPPDAAPTSTANARDIWASTLDEQSDDRPDLPIIFHFLWGTRTVLCRINAEDGGLVASVAADLGPVPYSSEEPYRREQLRALCHADFPLPHGRFVRTGNQRVIYTAHTPLPASTTGSDVATAVARLLLQGKPYFALLEG